MRQELAEELLSAAQEVVNGTWDRSEVEVKEPCVVVGAGPVDRLKAIVRKISDEGVAGVVAYAQETRKEPVNWEQIEAAVGHPFTPEEREKIAGGGK